MSDIYLVWSDEHRAWWRPNKCGYTVKLEAAGHYTRGEALMICAHARDGFKDGERPSEIPVRLEDATACVTAREIVLASLGVTSTKATGA